MVHRALVLISLACCTLVLASFVLFVNDQLAGASRHQQNELVSAVPVATSTMSKIKAEAQPRRFIDEAAQKLTSPFDSIVRSNNTWVRHGLPTALAMLVYGLGLGMLARFAQLAP